MRHRYRIGNRLHVRKAVVLDESPGDEEHLTMTDHKGRRTRFVFDHDSDKSDGTRKRPEGEIDVKGIRRMRRLS